MIIIDSREQLKLQFEKYIVKKLGEGDYTDTDLENIVHWERKSCIDFYGSLIQNHTRFTKMFIRAKEKNIKIKVLVEGSELEFLNKKFHGGERLKASSIQLAKMIDTMKAKYDFEVVYCGNRENMMNYIERDIYLEKCKRGLLKE